MRLIDADAYADEMRKRQDACRKWKSEQNEGSEMYARAEQALVTFVEAWVTLENQPTIAAIPVEWMRRYTAVGVAPTGNRLTEGNERLIVHRILNEWQKEQEAR